MYCYDRTEGDHLHERHTVFGLTQHTADLFPGTGQELCPCVVLHDGLLVVQGDVGGFPGQFLGEGG